MSKPIQAGDLVMVVKPTTCCGMSPWLGVPFMVTAVGIYRVRCKCCRAENDDVLGAMWPDGCVTDIRRLIRLDPDALRDDVPAREELTA